MRTIPILFVLAIAVGCSNREPRMIALRNSTGQGITNVSLRPDQDRKEGPGRLGGVSPLLPKVTYAYVRSKNAPKIPASVRVSWRDALKQNQSAIVATRQALDQFTGDREEALLFDIRPEGQVSALIERIPPSP